MRLAQRQMKAIAIGYRRKNAQIVPPGMFA
jgi:hypothetical protein